MFESLRPAGLIVIFLLIALWIYYRLVIAGRKHRRHGRDLWYERLEARRRERLEGAATWEERRRRKEALQPERKIADRYLREVSRSDPSAPPPGPQAGSEEAGEKR